ncbi:putative late blight resistance protein homolog R1B-11 [Solanum lycopersicum]|uniref:putative late blight resistance protein homolog R1B-11 n=1 Tax=Solanum lycopersicum TaxID=4081 RepID=UPI00374A75C3
MNVDHEIRVYDLLKLWMAEEFVLSSETENLEEASRVCLNDLLNRSLVMVSTRKINGDIERCILHDVVREFCLKKLKEEKFMQLTVPYSPYQHLCCMNSRLCVYIHDDLVKQLDHFEYQFDKIPMLESKETEVHTHTRLQSLNLIISPRGFFDSVGWESYFVFPSNLRDLCIGGCFLTKEMILNLARLEKLESFTLEGGNHRWESAYYCWDVTNVKFPALKYFELHFVKMEKWEASEESFSALKELSVRTGYFYKVIPPCFADITTLRLIKNCMTKNQLSKGFSYEYQKRYRR